MRLRGKILMFECNESYTLVGGKYMYCREGRWDANTPICISKLKIPRVGANDHGLLSFQ